MVQVWRFIVFQWYSLWMFTKKHRSASKMWPLVIFPPAVQRKRYNVWMKLHEHQLCAVPFYSRGNLVTQFCFNHGTTVFRTAVPTRKRIAVVTNECCKKSLKLLLRNELFLSHVFIYAYVTACRELSNNRALIHPWAIDRICLWRKRHSCFKHQCPSLRAGAAESESFGVDRFAWNRGLSWSR